jgi:biopolymer transport protein ExbD
MNVSRLNASQALAGSTGALSGSIPPPRRRGSRLFRTDNEAGPIFEINTTPLIDVMLVLLIMFIITIPMATHKVPLDLPRPSLTPMPPRLFHQLEISANGGLLWNGETLSPDQLRGHLGQLAADPATPELRVHADSEARYERVDEVLAWIRLAGVERLGFVGNERYGRAF